MSANLLIKASEKGRYQFEMCVVYVCLKGLHYNASIHNWHNRLAELENKTGFKQQFLVKYIRKMLKAGLAYERNGHLFFRKRSVLLKYYGVETFKPKRNGSDMSNSRRQMDMSNFYNKQYTVKNFYNLALQAKESQKTKAAIQKELVTVTGLKPSDLYKRIELVFDEHVPHFKNLLAGGWLPSCYIFEKDVAGLIGVKTEIAASKFMNHYLKVGKEYRYKFNPEHRCIRQTANLWYYDTGGLELKEHYWVKEMRKLKEEDLLEASVAEPEPVVEVPSEMMKEEKAMGPIFKPFSVPLKKVAGKRKGRTWFKAFYDADGEPVGLTEIRDKYDFPANLISKLNTECFYIEYKLGVADENGIRERVDCNGITHAVTPQLIQKLISLAKSKMEHLKKNSPCFADDLKYRNKVVKRYRHLMYNLGAHHFSEEEISQPATYDGMVVPIGINGYMKWNRVKGMNSLFQVEIHEGEDVSI